MHRNIIFFLIFFFLKDGSTPLHYASLSNNMRLVRLLIENGAASATFSNEVKNTYFILKINNYLCLSFFL